MKRLPSYVLLTLLLGVLISACEERRPETELLESTPEPLLGEVSHWRVKLTNACAERTDPIGVRFDNLAYAATIATDGTFGLYWLPWQVPEGNYNRWPYQMNAPKLKGTLGDEGEIKLVGDGMEFAGRFTDDNQKIVARFVGQSCFGLEGEKYAGPVSVPLPMKRRCKPWRRR